MNKECIKGKVILCPNPYKDKELNATLKICGFLEKSGFEVHISPEIIDGDNYPLPEGISYCSLADEIEGTKLIVSLGGDGTIMHTARRIAGYTVPLIGVNLGTVGFLAELNSDELPKILDAAEGNCTYTDRMMLSAEVFRNGEKVYSDIALNDIALHGIVQSIRLTAKSNNSKIFAFSGDGIVVASPTGSTAYSLSAGGPIVEPNADAIVLTPICAHNLSVRSCVVSASSIISVEIGGLREAKAVLAADGISFPLCDGDLITIRKSIHRTCLAHVGEKSFYDIVFEKLGDTTE